VAACIEQNNDEDGIIWPFSIAPYHVLITPVNTRNEDLLSMAEKLYDNLRKKGIEVLLDDRDERAGVKFKDADLIGIPLRITVGPKKLAEGKVEIRFRKSGEVREVPFDEVENFVVDAVRREQGTMSNEQ
jgi:prolyl-tRNA synthetase